MRWPSSPGSVPASLERRGGDSSRQLGYRHGAARPIVFLHRSAHQPGSAGRWPGTRWDTGLGYHLASRKNPGAGGRRWHILQLQLLQGETERTEMRQKPQLWLFALSK